MSEGCGNLRDELTECIDECVLGVREELGLQLAEVSIVTRTWTAEEPGDGSFSDNVEVLSPSPQIVDYSHNIRVQEAGAIKQGDLILKMIPRATYTEEQLRTDTGIKNVEKFIKVGNHYYRTIHVKENLVTWDIHIRKVSKDETEGE